MFQITFSKLRGGIKGKTQVRGVKKLTTEQEEEFQQEMEKLQALGEGGRVREQDIQILLEEKFYVDHALPSIYHVLERCGIS